MRSLFGSGWLAISACGEVHQHLAQRVGLAVADADVARRSPQACQNHFHARHSHGTQPAATSRYGQGVISQSQRSYCVPTTMARIATSTVTPMPSARSHYAFQLRKAQRAPQPVPAALGGLGRRLVVAGGQQQQIARLVAVERRRIRGQRLVAGEDAIDELA